jgi:hypothetical protein
MNMKLEKFIDDNIFKENVEIEVRFSNINIEQFNKYLDILNKKSRYNSCKNTTTDVYYTNGIRKTNDIFIRKQRIDSILHPSHKIVASLETPIQPTHLSDEPSFLRHKLRHSFTDKLLKHDLTIVNDNVFEIEIEILMVKARLMKTSDIALSLSKAINKVLKSI